ncbi:endonuclease [Amycolatopsis alkalitolerans]|uniref:Endonuclease n=1 Tax=Amycolatopsis alkalitolerans TaxID=2547244 RepID=A0A5C4LVU4_9PSEU|nr:endonuclease [Amycolatopsis alkalitolerans]TNC23493.1 endonuclease [Amycolatopsis alkalitolerans]
MADVRKVLAEAGRTFAQEAGIKLADTPAQLYRLLVLSVLMSAPIQAKIAIAATGELVRAGFGTPRRMADASWQQRVDALGRGHYVRYDESTATALGEGARLLLDKYRGDLRKLHAQAPDARALGTMLREFPRLGPVGVDIFCREAQQVWPDLRPYFDGKARQGAERLGLPTDPDKLAKLADGDDLARLAAALVRVSRDKKLADSLRQPLPRYRPQRTRFAPQD